MADKMWHLRREYDVVRGAINALDWDYAAGGVDTLVYRAQREIFVTRMWECFNRIKDEYDYQRREREKNAT